MEQININPVFLALTRQPMVMGVTVDYLCCCSVGVFILFMITHQPLMLLLFFPLYLMGLVMCYQDPNQFKVLLARLNCGFSPLKKIWGCHSYAPF